MKRLTINTIPILAASFFALAASANATDIFDQRHEVTADQAQVNWTGLWVGAVGGMNFFNTETDFTEHDHDDGKLEKHLNVDGLGAEGFFGEAQIGYDHQVSNQLVLGIFGGLNLSDAEFSATNTNIFNENKEFSVSTDYEWGSVLGARLGLLKSQDTMFYLAGGWAHAELGDTIINGETFASGPNLNGWFGELGMETRVTGNVYLTVSGRYTDYGSETLWDNNPGDGEDLEAIEIDTDSLAAMVGLKVKLGGF
jgi:outer membrane immunogenic protein